MLLTEREIQSAFRAHMYDPMETAREIEHLVAERCAAICESDAGMTAYECSNRIKLAVLREPTLKPSVS